MAQDKPVKITLRTYQVGFGDCFLLIFGYADGSEKFMLIDFGSTGLPDDFPSDQMLRVAKNIYQRCGKKLHAIVASHRHKDHISGFATSGAKDSELNLSSGEIIAACKPDVVIQPWTEDPKLDDEKVKSQLTLLDSETMKKQKDDSMFQNKKFGLMLNNMHTVANSVLHEGSRLGRQNEEGLGFVQPIDDKKRDLLKGMGDNNVKNLSAVLNLREMGKKGKAKFVNYGNNLSDVEKIFGIDIHVLGPPTLQQTNKILKQRSRDDDEFWMITASLQNYWKLQSLSANLYEEQIDTNNHKPNHPFPNVVPYENYTPSHTRWFIRRMRNLRAEQLLSIVNILDKSMNNTSVILLMEVGDKKLLFPGDAQIENWEYVLKHTQTVASDEAIRQKFLALLKETDLYKVGHHGSRNATPKTLWDKMFNKKTAEKTSSIAEKDKAMLTVNSTMEGKHGHTEATKVPRKSLVEELDGRSRYYSTESITKDFRDSNSIPDDEKGLYHEISL
jgi:hypothetical protein